MGESATDSFSYTVDDGNGGTDTAVVTVTVTGVNDAPVATANGIGVVEDATATDITATVLANDTDADGSDVLFVSGFDDTGTVGAVTLVDGPGGILNYDPNGQFESLAAGESAADTFS